jgi:two-component system, LytTR family, sensor kinase
MDLKKNDIHFNVQFWLVYFLYEWLANATIDSEYRRYFINAIVIVPLTGLAAFVTVHVLFKNFYLKEKKRAFWICLVVSMVIFIVIRRTFNYYYTYPLYFPEGMVSMPYIFLPKLIIEGVNIYLIVGLYSMFYFIKAWYEEQRLAHALMQEKAEAELSLLKSQIHPHFIFNTLNNIYSYAIQKNSKTPDLIYRLSSFLSYNIYDSKSDSIPLTKELEYIRSYIELEKIRYGDRLDVSINIFNSINQFNISPLLLLPVVENCFKHGFKSMINKCWIRIDISVQQDWLTIKIENSVGSDQNGNDHYRNGIGLENVRRRMDIVYRDGYEFKTSLLAGSFFCVLKIKNLATAHKETFTMAAKESV